MQYETRLNVRYADTGIQARLKPGMILNYFQDMATEHCTRLGVTGMDLLPKNLAWVVYRYQLNIRQYPVWRQGLHLKTWRHPANNLYELRAFEVRDDAGNLMITAKSAWILTRLDTRKPVRLKPHLPERMMTETANPIENDFEPLPEPTAADDSRSFVVRMHDLDFNRHVNNTVYAIWAMESAPRETAVQCLPHEIAIQYQGEAVFGNRITALTQAIGENPETAFIHTLYNDGSAETPITRVVTRWRPAEAFPGVA